VAPTFCSCSSLYWRHSFLPLPLFAGLWPAIQSNHSLAASCNTHTFLLLLMADHA
jgi:hypothetical protein